jgi:hypothetical protein
MDLRSLEDYSTMPEDMLITLMVQGDEQAENEYERKYGSNNKSVVPSDRALLRLALLPAPTDVTLDGPERYAQSAWQTTDKFTYDPDLYTEPVLAEVNLDELLGTDPNLSRKKIEAHITGKALTTNGHYALVVVKNGDKVILDGHHRLMAQWLLGNPAAQVWLVEEK